MLCARVAVLYLIHSTAGRDKRQNKGSKTGYLGDTIGWFIITGPSPHSVPWPWDMLSMLRPMTACQVRTMKRLVIHCSVCLLPAPAVGQPAQFAGSLSTTAAISSSVYILKPRSLVTLANCTFLASSFSSMTCLSVLSTSVSASAMVRDWRGR